MITIYTNTKTEDGDPVEFDVDDSRYHWGMEELYVWFHRPVGEGHTEKIIIPWTSIDYMVEA